MQRFSELAKTELVDKGALESFLNRKGYIKGMMQIAAVPHTKRMVAMVFFRNA
jgi:hypothetical protein